MAKFICGANMQHVERVSGDAVGTIMEQLEDVLNIPPTVQITVNGRLVRKDHILEEEDVVEFIKPAGEKGSF